MDVITTLEYCGFFFFFFFPPDSDVIMFMVVSVLASV